MNPANIFRWIKEFKAKGKEQAFNGEASQIKLLKAKLKKEQQKVAFLKKTFVILNEENH